MERVEGREFPSGFTPMLERFEKDYEWRKQQEPGVPDHVLRFLQQVDNAQKRREETNGDLTEDGKQFLEIVRHFDERRMLGAV